MPETPSRPSQRKERTGEVIAARMTKTIVVRVERRFRHPRFKKVLTRYKKLYAHDEKSEARLGDRVRVQETRPMSKLKSWRLVEILERRQPITPVAGSPAGA
ncbi:MAG TPA: 30S ribosomal protein S17 [Verrucomicrobiota bacterium]|nr:30S ribosomal protein S17 [Verrucomicrobiota bacterium]HNU50260.1 30S ribosomal protein S17 [Verrucomicrobiota bacterium]